MDRRVPNRPPTGLLRVNRAHPLANGLFDCFIFGPGGNLGFVNLGNASAAPDYTGAAKGKWVNNPNPGMRRAYVNGTTGTRWFTIQNTQLVNRYASDFSVFHRFIPHNSPGASNFPYVQAAGSGNASLCPVYDSTFTHQTLFFLGDASDSVSYALPAAFVLGATCSHGASRHIITPGVSGTITYYGNGVQFGQVGPSGGAPIATVNENAPIEFGTFNAANLEMDVTHIVFYTWTRALSAAEQLQLYLDPYCFLTPVNEAVFVTPSGVTYFPFNGAFVLP